jgi:hypothetical protein
VALLQISDLKLLKSCWKVLRATIEIFVFESRQSLRKQSTNFKAIFDFLRSFNYVKAIFSRFSIASSLFNQS